MTGIRPKTASVAFLLLVSIVAVAGGGETGPAAKKVERVLFLGNSITLHGPLEKIGWLNNWGMAASAAEKDYVHLLVDAIARRTGKRPEFRVENIADFERNFERFDLAQMKKHLDFKPDAIVVAIGENVPSLDSQQARQSFQASFARLLKTLQSEGRPAIYVRGCFWANAVKDDILRQCARDTGAVFVDIGGLGKDESNHARAERSYAHAGVADHPGDKGMKAIADALLAAMFPNQ